MTNESRAEEGIVPPHILDVQANLAFHAALGAIEDVRKTETADTGKYTYHYAPLGAVLDEVKRACRLHGLEVTQWPTVKDDHFALCLRLLHTSGGSVTFDPLIMTLAKDAQAFGSALTYARRYQLLTVFGIATEDDDGKAAHESSHRPPEPTFKTQHETRIRKALGDMTDAELRKKLVADFKVHFGVNLSELPEDLHEEAEDWVREYVATGRHPEEPF